jgi:hypothetical protein
MQHTTFIQRTALTLATSFALSLLPAAALASSEDQLPTTNVGVIVYGPCCRATAEEAELLAIGVIICQQCARESEELETTPVLAMGIVIQGPKG